MPGEGCLDFAQLDAKSAQLYLLIAAAGKLDLTISAKSGPVAGAIETRSRLAAERIGNKFLGSQFRLVEITASHACAADVHLAGFAHGAQPPLFIENVNFGISNRAADRNGSRVVVNLIGNSIQRNDAGRLSLAEHVNVPRRMRELFLPRARNVRTQSLAGGKQQTQIVVEKPPPRFGFKTCQDGDAVAME